MALEHVILGLLTIRPMSGYEMKVKMDVSTDFFWYATHSQIYPTLKRMEKRGLVTSEVIQQEGLPNKRVYSITEKGRTELTDWLVSPPELTFLRDDFLIKFFFFKEIPPDKALEILNENLRLHKEELEYYLKVGRLEMEKVRMRTPDEELAVNFKLLTLKRGIYFEEDYIRWLKEAIGVVEAHLERQGAESAEQISVSKGN